MMKSRIKALLKLNDMSLDNQRNLLLELNSLLGNCTQDLFDFKLKFENAGLLEKLLIQIIKHNSSLINLSKGSSIQIRGQDLRMDDLTAVYTVARLQIETFVNLSYLFFLDLEISDALKICVYKIQGSNQQIRLTKKHPKDLAQVKKMRDELAEELRKLRKLGEYQRASQKEKLQFRKPRYARLKKPGEIYDLIKIGNLSRTHSLYSNHIHSEYISIRQLDSSINSENASLFSTVLFICSRMTSLILHNLVTKYEIENGFYSKKSDVLSEGMQVLNNMYK